MMHRLMTVLLVTLYWQNDALSDHSFTLLVSYTVTMMHPLMTVLLVV